MLMVSLKEMYGYAIIVALVSLAAIILSDYRRFVILSAGKVMKLPEIWKVTKHNHVRHSSVISHKSGHQ